jgi:hypothetical protein
LALAHQDGAAIPKRQSHQLGFVRIDQRLAGRDLSAFVN